jgi:hypothetical protein
LSPTSLAHENSLAFSPLLFLMTSCIPSATFSHTLYVCVCVVGGGHKHSIRLLGGGETSVSKQLHIL